MIKYFYCFRHGKTDYNAKGLLQGSEIDAPLNEEGRQQALDIPHIDLDIIYSSPLKRALETASIYNNDRVPIIVKDDLREIFFNEWSGKNWKYLKKNDPTNYYRYKKFSKTDWAFKPGNGESAIDTANRAINTLQYIAKNSIEQNIGIFSHGAFLYFLSNKISDSKNTIPVLKNSEYFKCSYDTETEEFKLENR